MSLLNANDGNGNISTVYVTKVYKNSRNESFGDSVMSGMQEAMLPASKITSGIYRQKAIRAIKKRNRVLGYESDYIHTLSNYSAGNSITAMGFTSEAYFFDYIVKYCKMEIRAFKTAQKLGELSPKLMELLENPPHPAEGHYSKVFYVIRVNAMCILERVKALIGKNA